MTTFALRAGAALTAASLMLAAPAAAHHGRGGGHHGGGYDSGYRGGPAIVLYADPGFRGRSLLIDTRAPSLGRAGFNDRASSIEILSGTWRVCVHSEFRGRCEILSRSAPRLSRLGLNDNISSVRPVRGRHDGYGGYPGRGAVTLFTDPRFSGRAIPIGGAVPYLSQLRANDNVSSIDVRSGRWLVCTDPEFRGRCEVIEGPVRRLRDFGLNDNISSIRPLDRRGSRGRWPR